MASTISRAHMIINISHRANYTLVDVENCLTMCDRIDWEALRDESYELYDKVLQALDNMHLIHYEE